MFDESCTNTSEHMWNGVKGDYYTYLKLRHDVLNLLIEPPDGICLLLGLDELFGEPEKLVLLVGRCNACVDRLAYFLKSPEVNAFKIIWTRIVVDNVPYEGVQIGRDAGDARSVGLLEGVRDGREHG
jgi:hypothetical protein